MTKDKTIISSAPGKVILFGEHAVVYGKLGIAASINKKCLIRIAPSKEEKIFIESENFDLERALNKKELFELFETINNLKRGGKFEEMKKIYQEDKLIPAFFVIAHLMQRYGFKGLKIRIKSEVPKNLGSSAALFSALSFGVSKMLSLKLSEKEISDFAFEGDVIAHAGIPSGIDTAVCVYGGFVKYRKSEGVESLKINFKPSLLVVDSGEKTKTVDTVSYVREQFNKNPELVNSVLDSSEAISKKALRALDYSEPERLGELMFEYYHELKKLNISTPKLDRIVEIAAENKALGAKPTGGWGGGVCLVLVKNKTQGAGLIQKFKESGFNSFQVKAGVEGVKLS